MNWTVLTRASFAPALKLNFTVSMKCSRSILISTKIYNIFIPSVALIGTIIKCWLPLTESQQIIVRTFMLCFYCLNRVWNHGKRSLWFDLNYSLSFRTLLDKNGVGKGQDMLDTFDQVSLFKTKLQPYSTWTKIQSYTL